MTIRELSKALGCKYHSFYNYISNEDIPKPDIRLNAKQRLYSQKQLNDLKKSEWALDRFPMLAHLELKATTK